VRQLVDAFKLPPGCHRVVEAMARCHEEHGSGVSDKELMIGYGLRGDPERIAARTRARGEPPVFDGIAEEARLSRRYTICCVALLVAAGVVRRWWGGPHADPRENARDHLQRANKAGERREHVQGIGGAGWANAYTVDGISDPLPPDDPPPPSAPPSPPIQPVPEHARKSIRAMRDGLERDRVERQRRRLAEEEEARGP
jgi:hypothetical protein